MTKNKKFDLDLQFEFENKNRMSLFIIKTKLLQMERTFSRLHPSGMSKHTPCRLTMFSLYLPTVIIDFASSINASTSVKTGKTENGLK